MSEQDTVSDAWDQEHPAVEVSVPPYEALIDEKLAPTIEALWRMGFRTFNSCQHWPGSPKDPPEAWIDLDARQAQIFLDIILSNPDRNESFDDRFEGPFHERLLIHHSVVGNTYGGWRYRLSVFDEADTWEGNEVISNPRDAAPSFRISVHFPTAQIPLVEAIVTEAAESGAWEERVRRLIA